MFSTAFIVICALISIAIIGVLIASITNVGKKILPVPSASEQRQVDLNELNALQNQLAADPTADVTARISELKAKLGL